MNVTKQPAWQGQRRILLELACNQIPVLTQAGIPITEAFRRVARKYSGRSLGHGRRLRLSEPTLRRLWYVWHKRQTARAFDLHYKPACQISITPELFERMISVAIEAGLTVSELYARFGGQKLLRISERTLHRILPRRLAELAREGKKVERIKIMVIHEAKRAIGTTQKRRAVTCKPKAGMRGKAIVNPGSGKARPAL
ncbi:MAG: hypothetical protein PHW60_11315 [Kiritimatiellae bacterium]|nr:hypothetical protein [Kiritimatiellia bacterium]